MVLQTSGAISLNNIHVEAGGSSGSQATINDSDIRSLIGKSSGATMSFNEWYGASNFPTFSPSGTTPFSLANLRIGPDSGGHGYKYIGNYEFNSLAITMRPDGYKAYITGTIGDGIDEFTLSTAWKMSTASHTNFKSFSSAGYAATLPYGIAFKPDGTRLLMVDNGGDKLVEYSLSSAWNVSTLSYVRNFSVSSYDNSPTGLWVKPDGTKLYMTSDYENGVDQFTLNNAWQLSSVTHNGVWDAFNPGGGSSNSGINSPDSVWLNSNGTKFYVVDTPDLFEFSTSSAYNVSGLPTNTSSYNYRVPSSYVGSTTYFLGSWSDGTRLVQTSRDRDIITVELTTGSAYDYRFLTFDDPRFHTYLPTAYFRSGTPFYFSSSGHRLYYTSYYGKLGSYSFGGVSGSNNQYNSYVMQIDMTEGYNLSTASIARAIDFESTSPKTMGVFFSRDGSYMYTADGGNSSNSYNQTVKQYTLSTAWEINTASYTREYNVHAYCTSIVDLHFSTDGTKMYCLCYSTDKIYQWALSTAWNISTASYSTQWSTSSQETSPRCFTISPNGSKMIMGGWSGDDLNEYNLNTADNIASASYQRVVSTNSNALAFTPSIGGVQFHEDGGVIYVGDGNNGISIHGLLL